jgi:putative Mg2+ transporter-C (MgtC) family protein
MVSALATAPELEQQLLWTLLLRVAVALALGSVIGLERRLHRHPAGLHTNALVGAGAAIFCVLSTLVPDPSATRVAGQVVTGVGFICAGLVFHRGNIVRGINTAATVWCTTSIGVLCGSGFLRLATGCGMLVLVSNIVLHRIEHHGLLGRLGSAPPES